MNESLTSSFCGDVFVSHLCRTVHGTSVYGPSPPVSLADWALLGALIPSGLVYHILISLAARRCVPKRISRLLLIVGLFGIMEASVGVSTFVATSTYDYGQNEMIRYLLIVTSYHLFVFGLEMQRKCQLMIPTYKKPKFVEHLLFIGVSIFITFLGIVYFRPTISPVCNLAFFVNITVNSIIFVCYTYLAMFVGKLFWVALWSKMFWIMHGRKVIGHLVCKRGKWVKMLNNRRIEEEDEEDGSMEEDDLKNLV